MKRYHISESIISKLNASLSKDGRLIQKRFYDSLIDSEMQYLNKIQNELNAKFSSTYLKDHIVGNEFVPEFCPTCGKVLINGKGHCSRTCANNDPNVKNAIIENRLKTIRQKYGVDNAFQAKEIKEKIKQTNIEKYGVENPQQNSDISNKTSSTMLERYGVKRYSQTEDWKDNIKLMYDSGLIDVKAKNEKYRNTCLEKYGCPYASQADSVKQKVNTTMLEKYGTSYLASDECKQKFKEYSLKHYGTENMFSSEKYKEEQRQKCLAIYGVDHPLKRQDIRQHIKEVFTERYGYESNFHRPDIQIKVTKHARRLSYDKFLSSLERKGIVCTNEMSIENYIDCNYKFTFKCTRCSTEWQTQLPNKQTVCPKCSKNHSVSQDEKELLDYIKSLYNGEIIENSKSVISPLELDIYLPEKCIAFEYNGNYWHSDENKHRLYHQHKSIECANKGIRLIHVYEYEWVNKKDKVKSLIKESICGYDLRVYARKCDVRQLCNKQYEDFLKEYHLDGPIKSSIRYGLFFNDELLSVIGFGKSKRSSSGEIILQRYCCKAGVQVVGGLSKLIKHSNVKEFYSFIDLGKYSGSGYMSLGFKSESIQEPRYVYVKRNNTVLQQYQCQKHLLSHILGDAFDSSKSSYDNMLSCDYKRVYDSGAIKVKFVG